MLLRWMRLQRMLTATRPAPACAAPAATGNDAPNEIPLQGSRTFSRRDVNWPRLRSPRWSAAEIGLLSGCLPPEARPSQTCGISIIVFQWSFSSSFS